MDKKPFIDFEGQIVLVTGATSGIGKAIAIQLSQCGAKVILSGRNLELLEETSSEIGNGSSISWQMDLIDIPSILPSIKKLASEHGRIYGFCHSAGIIETKPLRSIDMNSLRSLMEINVNAGLELAKCITRRDVMTQDCGSILFMSSISSWIASPGQVAYSASKGAILSAARTMAIELARRNIRVNTISPGLVKTPMAEKSNSLMAKGQVSELESAHPLGPGEPGDVARAAAFILAPQNKWLTGSDLIIDGGFTAR